MQRISFAPVLSATLSRDSCWIICFSLSSWFSTHEAPSLAEHVVGYRARPGERWLLGLLEDLHDAPALRGGQRAGLHHEDPVADAALVLLVMRLELARAAQDLAVQGVLDPVLDGHDHGLVHLVADHQALADLAGLALGGVLARCHRLGHAAPPFDSVLEPGVLRMPSSRSRTTV